MRNLLLIFFLGMSACARKPDAVQTIALPEQFSLTMERFNPRPPVVEFVPHDSYLPTEHVFINHPAWKSREEIPIVWRELQAGCRLYHTPAAMALTAKREIAWRVQGFDCFYWSKWQLSVENLPAEQQPTLRTALFALGHLPYEITDFDLSQRQCVLSLTHPSYSLPSHLVFRFHSTVTAPNGASIADGTYVFEHTSPK
jgi:hypothetical protein